MLRRGGKQGAGKATVLSALKSTFVQAQPSSLGSAPFAGSLETSLADGKGVADPSLPVSILWSTPRARDAAHHGSPLLFSSEGGRETLQWGEHVHITMMWGRGRQPAAPNPRHMAGSGVGGGEMPPPPQVMCIALSSPPHYISYLQAAVWQHY